MKCIFLLIILFLHCVYGRNVSTSYTINTENGPITGEKFRTKYSRGGAVWLGIPYAEPPVGKLRFASTEPLSKTWTVPRPAKFWGANCLSNSQLLNQSEDCLFLNIWTPPIEANKSSLAVMVFLHGGGWTYGSSSKPLYTGKDLIGSGQDVIVVSLNYRLRAFGFLGSSILANAYGSTGNFGLQDQRMALKWIRSNIANFGGDPNNVLLFGESAGAGSISCHLIMPNSWGLFNRAVMESGPFARWTAVSMDVADYKYNETMEQVNCTLIGTSASQQLECLRNVDALILDQVHIHDKTLLTPWAPTIDGVEITESPETLAAAGKIANVPVMLGTNLNEGTMFTGNVSRSLNKTEYELYMSQLFGPTVGPQVVEHYPVSDFVATGNCSAAYWANAMVWSDYWMACPARRSAIWLSTQQKNTYLYWFTRELDIISKIAPYAGVFHGSELMFVWYEPNHLVPMTNDEMKLASQIGEFWTNFARTGECPWPAFNISSQINVVLDIPLSNISFLKEKQCDFWDSI